MRKIVFLKCAEYFIAVFCDKNLRVFLGGGGGVDPPQGTLNVKKCRVK